MMYDHSFTASAIYYGPPDIEQAKKSITARPVKGGLKLRIGSTVKSAAPEFGAPIKSSIFGNRKLIIGRDLHRGRRKV